MIKSSSSRKITNLRETLVHDGRDDKGLIAKGMGKELKSIQLQERKIITPFFKLSQSLVSIDLQNCDITNPDIISTCVLLRYASLAGNFIEAIPSCLPSLKCLQFLDLGSNKISTAPNIVVLENAPKSLIYLNLCGNIVSRLPKYREFVIKLCKDLIVLDNLFILDEERIKNLDKSSSRILSNKMVTVPSKLVSFQLLPNNKAVHTSLNVKAQCIYRYHVSISPIMRAQRHFRLWSRTRKYTTSFEYYISRIQAIFRGRRFRRKLNVKYNQILDVNGLQIIETVMEDQTTHTQKSNYIDIDFYQETRHLIYILRIQKWFKSYLLRKILENNLFYIRKYSIHGFIFPEMYIKDVLHRVNYRSNLFAKYIQYIPRIQFIQNRTVNQVDLIKSFQTSMSILNMKTGKFDFGIFQKDKRYRVDTYAIPQITKHQQLNKFDHSSNKNTSAHQKAGTSDDFKRLRYQMLHNSFIYLWKTKYTPTPFKRAFATLQPRGILMFDYERDYVKNQMRNNPNHSSKRASGVFVSSRVCYFLCRNRFIIHNFYQMLAPHGIPVIWDQIVFRNLAAIEIQRIWRGYYRRQAAVPILIHSLLRRRAAAVVQRWWRYYAGLYRRLQLLRKTMKLCKSITTRSIYLDSWVYYLFLKGVTGFSDFPCSCRRYPELQHMVVIDTPGNSVGLVPMSLFEDEADDDRHSRGSSSRESAASHSGSHNKIANPIKKSVSKYSQTRGPGVGTERRPSDPKGSLRSGRTPSSGSEGDGSVEYISMSEVGPEDGDGSGRRLSTSSKEQRPFHPLSVNHVQVKDIRMVGRVGLPLWLGLGNLVHNHFVRLEPLGEINDDRFELSTIVSSPRYLVTTSCTASVVKIKISLSGIRENNTSSSGKIDSPTLRAKIGGREDKETILTNKSPVSYKLVKLTFESVEECRRRCALMMLASFDSLSNSSVEPMTIESVHKRLYKSNFRDVLMTKLRTTGEDPSRPRALFDGNGRLRDDADCDIIPVETRFFLGKHTSERHPRRRRQHWIYDTTAEDMNEILKYRLLCDSLPMSTDDREFRESNSLKHQLTSKGILTLNKQDVVLKANNFKYLHKLHEGSYSMVTTRDPELVVVTSVTNGNQVCPVTNDDGIIDVKDDDDGAQFSPQKMEIRQEKDAAMRKEIYETTQRLPQEIIAHDLSAVRLGNRSGLKTMPAERPKSHYELRNTASQSKTRPFTGRVPIQRALSRMTSAESSKRLITHEVERIASPLHFVNHVDICNEKVIVKGVEYNQASEIYNLIETRNSEIDLYQTGKHKRTELSHRKALKIAAWLDNSYLKDYEFESVDKGISDRLVCAAAGDIETFEKDLETRRETTDMKMNDILEAKREKAVRMRAQRVQSANQTRHERQRKREVIKEKKTRDSITVMKQINAHMTQEVKVLEAINKKEQEIYDLKLQRISNRQSANSITRIFNSINNKSIDVEIRRRKEILHRTAQEKIAAQKGVLGKSPQSFAVAASDVPLSASKSGSSSRRAEEPETDPHMTLTKSVDINLQHMPIGKRLRKKNSSGSNIYYSLGMRSGGELDLEST